MARGGGKLGRKRRGGKIKSPRAQEGKGGGKRSVPAQGKGLTGKKTCNWWQGATSGKVPGGGGFKKRDTKGEGSREEQKNYFRKKTDRDLIRPGELKAQKKGPVIKKGWGEKQEKV